MQIPVFARKWCDFGSSSLLTVRKAEVSPARRALIWCRQVAGTRIHGTTRQAPWNVFEAEEKSALLPLNPERFDTPRWAVCKVHPDHHIRLDHALYSLPTRFVGKSVDVRADRSLVRIYSGAELLCLRPVEQLLQDL